MIDSTLSQRLAEFAALTTYEVLPKDVVASVKGRVLDIIGICLAATQLATSRSAMAWVEKDGGNGQATAIGLDAKVPVSGAAFVNGVLAHSLDYDDTHLPSVLHPSASVVPAALAVAEAVGAPGREVIAAIAVGIETSVRLGMAGYDTESGNSVFFENGQHATSITGAMGSAVAVAKLLGLDSEGIANTLGVAASMASGIIESNRTGGTVKRMHCGWAARAAVAAAELVHLGITGPPTVLEGRFGFYQAWLHGAFTADEITKGLGQEWSVPGIFFKPYPANHFTHAAIDAVLSLRADGLRPEHVSSIEVQTASATLRTIGEPIDVKREPETGYMAQFSAPFVVAAALYGGEGLGLGLDDFTDERAQDPQLRELMSKVSVVASSKCDKIFPYQFPAIVTVVTKDGETMTKEALVNRGGPQNPLSFEELGKKFQDNAERVLNESQIGSLKAFIGALDEQDRVDRMFDANAAIIANASSN